MAANRIFIQVDFQQAQAVANVNQLNQSIASLGPATQKATQQASSGISSLSLTVQQAQRSFAGIGSAIASFGLIRGGQGLIEIAADLDTLRRTLELWEGSQEKANERFEQFRQLSQKAGISLEPALRSYSRLMSVTKDSAESVRIIEGFGRALGQMGRGGEDLSGVIEQVTQSLSKRGSVMREDLKFIQQYVPQVTGILEKLYGTSDTEKLAKMGHTSAKVWREVTAELLKLKEVTPGIRKEMELFFQEMRVAGEEFGKTLAKEIKPALDDILKASQELAKWWKDLAPETRTLFVQLGETAIVIGGIATAIGLVTGAVTKLAVVLAANPVVLALLGIGATVYGTYKGLENISEYIDRKYGPKVGSLPGGTGIGTFGRMRYALEMIPALTSPNPYYGFGYGPQGPGVPKGMAAPEEGYKIPPPPSPAAPKELRSEEKSAMLSLAKWMEDARQKTAKGVEDAIADQQKHYSKFVTAEKQIQMELAALAAERQKVWNDLVTRVDPQTGKQQVLSLKQQQELMVKFAEETALRKSVIEDSWRREQIEKNREMLGQIAEAQAEADQAIREARSRGYQQMLEEQGRLIGQQIEQDLHNQQQALELQRDRRLLLLEEVGGETLEQQMALADQRLAVENEYVEKALEVNLKLLDVDRQRAQFQLEAMARATGMFESQQFMENVAAIEELYRTKREAMVTGADEQRETNRLKTIGAQSKMIRSEMQKTFEYFQDLAEGVFDALLSKSKSVTQALGDFFKQTFLTIIKGLYSNMIAAGLMRLFGMQAPAQAGGPFGTGRVGGGGGGWGNILGGIGGSIFGGWNHGYGTPNWGGWGGGTFPAGTGASTGGRLGGFGGLLPFGMPGNPLDMLRSIGNIGMKTGLVGEKFGSVPGAAGSNATGVGGLGGAALLGGGGTLLFKGLQRGGLSGLGMSTAGGAMIGLKFGGPVGMAIGAAAGALAGTIRLFIKGAKEKLKSRIKEIYGVDIASDGILSQIADIVKTQYGGDMNVGLYAPEVRELIQLYAMTQGTTASGMGRPMYPVSWALSGGTAAVQPVYSAGSMVANPYVGMTTTQQNATYIQLNPQQANQLFEGRVVQVIGDNPAAVADASTSAMEPTYRRSREQTALMEPMTLMS